MVMQYDAELLTKHQKYSNVYGSRQTSFLKVDVEELLMSYSQVTSSAVTQSNMGEM